MMAKMREREAELFAALRGWKLAQPVLIGGYAASAWAHPRFSLDMDFVVPHGSKEDVRDYLTRAGLSKTEERPAIEQNYGGSWERWEGGVHGITFDLLIGSVQDRDFRIPYPYERVAKGAVQRPVRGLEESGLVMTVASKETLIALKVKPMRRTDVGDIACLASAGFNEGSLREQMAPIIERRPDLLRERLARFESALGPDDASAQRFLGPRIAGPPRVREPVIRAARRLHRLLIQWVEEDPGR